MALDIVQKAVPVTLSTFLYTYVNSSYMWYWIQVLVERGIDMYKMVYFYGVDGMEELSMMEYIKETINRLKVEEDRNRKRTRISKKEITF